MGFKRWDPNDWTQYSNTHVNNKATVGAIYTSTNMDASLDPKGTSMRESCDSAANPNSTAIIIGLDVTGSMGSVLNSMARVGLKTLAEEIYNRKPVSDPHIMFMGIGDVACGDEAPLQVTQFEADIRIAEQLTKIWLEEGGGGNGSESYALAWYSAGMHTRIDCFEKRNKKGFIFTVGDDGPTPHLTRSEIEKVFGYKVEKDLTSEELLTMASRQYEVYHLMLTEGRRASDTTVINKWKNLLGERAIKLTDHTKMGEVIVSILQHAAGIDKATIQKSWDGSTGIVVSQALDGLTATVKTDAVIRF